MKTENWGKIFLFLALTALFAVLTTPQAEAYWLSPYYGSSCYGGCGGYSSYSYSCYPTCYQSAQISWRPQVTWRPYVQWRTYYRPSCTRCGWGCC